MEVLASRVLLHPADLGQSLAFYRDTLGLPIYREWGEEGRPGHGTVFFLGGGYLELSSGSASTPTDKLELWWQVRDVNVAHDEMKRAAVEIVEAPVDKPWGLREMRMRDPDGVIIVVVEIPKSHPLRYRP